ncbi:MAG: ECF-type sigma factor [Acidobacteriota bacterium]
MEDDSIAPDITALLKAWERGDLAARDELFSWLYPQLRRIAKRHLASQREVTLQATELLHETYLRVSQQRRLEWSNRVQFFAFAAQVIRQVLVDRQRRREALKRGRGFLRVEVETDELAAPLGDVDLLALDDALRRLAEVNSQAAQVVELRFFGGLTLPEIAEHLSLGEATAQRRWAMARAWLRRELG